MPRAEAYGASKAAVSYFARTLAVDLKKKGIKVVTVFPGFVETPLTDKNTFDMPMIVSVNQASAAIRKQLDANKSHIYFPARFTGVLRFISLLPYSWASSAYLKTRIIRRKNHEYGRKKKIAIVGTGISGLTCGYYLHKEHDVTLFEANDYVGGHTATVDVSLDGKEYAIDTGFIVYNDRTYPNFIEMMDEIGVEGIPTQMSFSVRNDGNGLEYNGHTVSTLFAQKRNWANPKFYRFIFEILRFNKLAKSFANEQLTNNQTLGSRFWMSTNSVLSLPTTTSCRWALQFGRRH